MTTALKYWWRRSCLRVAGGGVLVLAMFMLLVLNVLQVNGAWFWSVAIGLVWLGGGLLLLAHLLSAHADRR